MVPKVQFGNNGGGGSAPFDGFYGGNGVDPNVLRLFHGRPKWHYFIR